MTKTVAVIGCGYWGKNLVKNFAALGSLAAIHDPHPETAAKFSADYNVPALSWDDIMTTDSIDGVVIAAPAELHAKLATEAIMAGKHVYVEKPLALTIAEGQALCDLAIEQDRILMVGHLLQYHPVFARLRDLVRAGDLGDIRYLYSNRLSLGKFRAEENVLWSFAPHDISMIMSLTGEEPETITCEGSNHVLPGIADTARLNMKFPGGAFGHIFASWLHPFKEHRFVVVGSKKMAVFEDSQPQWEDKLVIYEHDLDETQTPAIPTKKDGQKIIVEHQEPLRCECQHFLDCLQSGQTPVTDGQEALRVLKVLQDAEAGLAASIENNKEEKRRHG